MEGSLSVLMRVLMEKLPEKGVCKLQTTFIKKNGHNLHIDDDRPFNNSRNKGISNPVTVDNKLDNNAFNNMMTTWRYELPILKIFYFIHSIDLPFSFL